MMASGLQDSLPNILITGTPGEWPHGHSRHWPQAENNTVLRNREIPNCD